MDNQMTADESRPDPDRPLAVGDRPGYRNRMKELIQQAAFKKGLVAAQQQIDLSDKVDLLDAGLMAAIVLAVVDVVVEEAIGGMKPDQGGQP